MKRLFTTLIFAFLIGYTSAQESGKQYSFSHLNPYEINEQKLQQSIDSIYYLYMDSLNQLKHYAMNGRYTSKYVAFFIGYTSSQASLENLNAGLVANGFAPFPESLSHVPLGFDVKGKRWLFSYRITIPTKNVTTSADYSVKLKTLGFTMGFGYAVVNAKRFQLYPQLAFGSQEFEIDVTRNAASTDIVNFNGLLAADSETVASKSNFIVDYALEADYHLSYSDSKGGIIIGARVGGISNIVDKNFKINDHRSAFNLNDHPVKTYASVILKLYIKNTN